MENTSFTGNAGIPIGQIRFATRITMLVLVAFIATLVAAIEPADAAWYAPFAGNSTGLYPQFAHTSPWCNPEYHKGTMYVSLEVVVTVDVKYDPCLWPGRCTVLLMGSVAVFEGYGMRVTVAASNCSAIFSYATGSSSAHSSITITVGTGAPWDKNAPPGATGLNTTYPVNGEEHIIPEDARCNVAVIVECMTVSACTCPCGAPPQTPTRNVILMADPGDNRALAVATASQSNSELSLTIIGTCTTDASARVVYTDACVVVTGNRQRYSAVTSTGTIPPPPGGRSDYVMFMESCTATYGSD